MESLPGIEVVKISNPNLRMPEEMREEQLVEAGGQLRMAAVRREMSDQKIRLGDQVIIFTGTSIIITSRDPSP